jgi:ABC-2 type transport system permease protein
VDATGQLAEVRQVQVAGDDFALVPYASQEAAQAGYEADEVQAYLVIPEGYLQGAPVQFYAEEEPTESVNQVLMALLRQALLPDAPAWALERLEEPTSVTFVAQQDQTVVEDGPAMIARYVVPAVLAIFFVLAVLTSASQMGDAIVREKDQRAMEIIITSLSPRDLVAGKVLGMSLLTLTQIAIWGAGAVIAGGLALAGVDALGDLLIPWQAVVWGVALGVPAYLLFAILSAGLGVISGNSQQAQQYAGLLGLVSASPFWFLPIALAAPNGPIAIALTLFPLTGPAVALVRMIESSLPAWQLWASLGISLVCLAGSVWLVARLFRAAMLMYGQAIKPQQIIQALRQA